MASITEIAPDVYRISVYATWANLQFNHFLVKDDEPLLFHTGLRGMFPDVREAVSQLIDPSQLRAISFSHFEADECGALPEWLAVAPRAQVVCSDLGAMVSVNDFIGRPARGLEDGSTFSTGQYRFRFCRTPHLPHGWDAGVLFEETQQTLLSDTRKGRHRCSRLWFEMSYPASGGDVGRRSNQIAIEHRSGFMR
jgi:flavorubredoxin